MSGRRGKSLGTLPRAVACFSSLVAVVDTLPAERPESMTDRAAVAAELEEIASSVTGKVGYAVIDGEGELLFARLEAKAFPQASAIKIPLLMEVLAQRDEGQLDWHQQYPITKAVQVGGSGILAEFSDGGSTLCVEDLCTLMITLSDNTATNLLIDLVGMDAVNRRLDGLGCPQTRLRRVMMDFEAAQRGEENVSTPAEAARIMRVLARGEFYSPAVSAEVLGFLQKPKGTAIRKAIPAEIPLASKPGGIPGVATEWAWVCDPQTPYGIALMGKDGDEEQFRHTFTELARKIHEAMTAAP